MDNKSSIFRGRYWSLQEIEMIKETIKTSPNRTAISRKVCKTINWRQANGCLKDAACREVLRKMDSKGLINLPPAITYSAKLKLRSGKRGLRPREKWEGFFEVRTRLMEGVLGEVILRIVNNGTSRNLWE